VERPARTGPSPWWGSLLGAALVASLSGVLVPLRHDVSRATPALLLVLPVVVGGLTGGRRASLATAVVAAAAFNLVFVPPFWTLKVAVLDDGVAIAVFVVVALAVGTLVAVENERRMAAEQRAMELEALHQRYEGVLVERERLAEEANRMQVLERVDEQRSALLRSVSHDLRTPLATIRAVASDLRDGTRYDQSTSRELLETVCDEAERLDRLVANLLDLSRIEAGALRPELQAVAMDELVTERLRRLGRLFAQVRLQVEVPPDLPLVDGDYTQLDQVLTNLLENAARHAPAGSTVRVTARTVGPMVELRVADEGIGVAEYERGRIFEPFRRGEGSGSSGIGLAICKAVAEAHGGSVAVERTPGGGATFVVVLPVRAAADNVLGRPRA